MGYAPEPLYEVPIEKLGLSVATINVLKRQGLTTIGDCIDFFARGNNVTAPSVPNFVEAMFDEVKPKLEQRGYLPLDTDNS